jgi:ATP-dependent Clp protease ATP-binding subunit ClpB
MRLEKFTIKAQEALQESQTLAEQHGNQELEAEHLLTILITQEDGVVPPILRKLGANIPLLQDRMQERLEKFPKVSGASGGSYISPRLKTILDQAHQEAEQFKDEFVSTEHLLLAMSVAKNAEVARILQSLGVTHDALLKALMEVRGNQRITDQSPEEKFQVLDKYCKDLTALSKQGKLDPVI